jgi:D-arabinose 1-dehydrogenase-like Zn-dependent alcohol dehydrogenase
VQSVTFLPTRCAIDPLAAGAGTAQIAGMRPSGAGGGYLWPGVKTSPVRAEPGKVRSMLLLLRLDVADLAGDAQVCPSQTQPGFTGPGSFAEFVAVHAADANLVALPAGVDVVTAACLGCRFATAFRAVTAHGRVQAGDWLAVHGCGGVGLSAVMIGTALGARVVAVDISAAALERARALGAEATVDAGAAGPVALIEEITVGGAHVSIDALGSPTVAANSVRCLRRRGRHIQVGLLPGGPVPLPMDLAVARELEIYGSHGMAARDYPAMMRLVADGTLRPGLLVGDVIGLEEAGRALAAMDEPAGVGMTVVKLAE